MVFVAYGIVADSINRNDLKGVNVTGKIVVMLRVLRQVFPKKLGKTKKPVGFLSVV